MICIKENTFDNISNSEKIKIFKNQSNFTIIIYDQLIINEVKKMILKFDIFIIFLFYESYYRWLGLVIATTISLQQVCKATIGM